MKKSILILVILLTQVCLYSQTSPDSLTFTPQYQQGIHYVVKTRHGEVYRGYVKEETKEFVKLENRITHETVELRKSEIVRINQPKTRDLSTEILGENHHAGNYMLSNSAFLFEENKVSTNSHWLLLENINYAITDNWALSLNTLAFYPISIGVKCAYQVGDENYLGAGVFAIGDITSGSSGSFLFGYGAQAKFTRGSSNKNMTFSAGVLGLNSDLFYTSSSALFVNTTFVSAAYCNRFNKKVALNLEGWYLPEISSGLAGVGFKFVGDEVTCWTVGCYAIMNSSDNSLKVNFKTLPIPYFGVSRKFN